MPKTLLLADDSVTIQKVVGISFANEDVTLVTVDNGDDALARAREVRPDLVLADVVMPGLSGYELCQAIKSDPGLRHIPVLLLTGTFEAFDEARAAQVGADGHITKPFEAQALVDNVNARLAAAPAPAPSAPPPVAGEEHPEAPAPSLRVGEETYDFFEEEPRGAAIASAETPPRSDDVAEPDEDEAGRIEGALGAPLAFDAGSFERPSAPTQAADPLEPAAPAPLGDDDLFGDAEPGQPVEELEASELETDGSWAEPLADEALDDPAATRVLAPEFAPSPGAEERADPMDDWFAAAPTHPGAPAAATPTDPLAAVEPEELSGEAVPDPAAARDYDVSSSDLGEPLAATSLDEPAAAPVEPAPPPLGRTPETAPVGVPERTAAPAAPEEQSARPDLSPLMREQLHEALEKIAWEAFSDTCERIVADALDRIEQVAWEVLPQMAEALIREEIRKLKGEE